MSERSPVTVGDYTLVPHPRWLLWTAERSDGDEIPSCLSGQFTDPEDFRRKAEQVHGDAYSWDRIQHRRKAELHKRAMAEREMADG